MGTVAETQKVMGALSSGKGTIGRLLYDDTLYQEVRAPIARIDNLVQGIEKGQGTAGKAAEGPGAL